MISVCMATYNGAKYIKEQIESILSQIDEDDELIISDDGSTDKTIDIIKEFNDSRIKLVEFKINKKGIPVVNKVTKNFENALKLAKGDYIYLADQDDVWADDKVRVSLEYLINRDYDYIVSDCYITDSNLNIISNTRFDGSITRNKYKALIAPTPWQGSCAAFKRKVLAKALPFPKGLQSHDRWIGYIGSLIFKSKIIDKPLVYYRRHDTNTSTATSGKSGSTFKYKVKTRLYYIFNLFKRMLK